jgi:hypothetical protein
MMQQFVTSPTPAIIFMPTEIHDFFLAEPKRAGILL